MDGWDSPVNNSERGGAFLGAGGFLSHRQRGAGQGRRVGWNGFPRGFGYGIICGMAASPAVRGRLHLSDLWSPLPKGRLRSSLGQSTHRQQPVGVLWYGRTSDAEIKHPGGSTVSPRVVNWRTPLAHPCPDGYLTHQDSGHLASGVIHLLFLVVVAGDHRRPTRYQIRVLSDQSANERWRFCQGSHPGVKLQYGIEEFHTVRVIRIHAS